MVLRTCGVLDWSRGGSDGCARCVLPIWFGCILLCHDLPSISVLIPRTYSHPRSSPQNSPASPPASYGGTSPTRRMHGWHSIWPNLHTHNLILNRHSRKCRTDRGGGCRTGWWIRRLCGCSISCVSSRFALLVYSVLGG